MLMQKRLAAALAAIALAVSASADTTIFTQWNFDATGPVGPVDDTGLPTDAPFFGAGAIYNSPAPTLGSGVITPLGMDNSYIYATNPVTIGSVAYCDVLSTSGLGATPYTISTWRVRGPSNAAAPPGNGNGWNRSAPERTQGAQFSASTVGYSGIHFSCQFYSTTQGVSAAQAQYTLDGANWTDFGSYIAMKSNDFLQPAGGTISDSNLAVNLDFSGIAGADNNPNFGVRLVSVYDPRYTGTNPAGPTYAAATNPVTTPYNNSSGNWRFGLVTFSGSATGPIPEVLRASATRSAVCTAEANPVTFNILVQPGANPASTGMQIIADLTSIGLGTQNMTGNMAGTFFTYSGTIPANTVSVPGAPVTRTITFTATDAQSRQAVSTATLIFVNCAGSGGSSSVLISQVYGGGGNSNAPFKNDFIELFNRGLSAQSLGGWSVQYATDTGATWTPVALPSMTLNPGQYLLVQMGSGGSVGANLPAAEVANATNMNATAGKVALVNSVTPLTGSGCGSSSVVDFVGYGTTASCYEGAGFAPAPSNTNAIIRAKLGNIDTDTNNADFAAGAPTPHNSSSTLNPGSLVISQIYGGGGNTDPVNALNQGVYDSDFIEIYNRSASSVDLTNWSVQSAGPTNGGGFTAAGNVVPLSGTILPRQYMLIRFSDPVRGFSPLPTPDFSTIYGYGGLGNNGGRVALVRHTAGAIIPIGTSYISTTTGANQFIISDLVGYGTGAITFEGAGPAFTPDNAHAVIRKSSLTDSNLGAQDTDQNFNDFVVASPFPHNRASNGTTNFLTAYASIPATDPDVVRITNSACIGSVVNFNVSVTPGSASTNIAVNADVSAFTGVPGSVQLFDDGPTGGHGDAQAGDGVFSLAYAIPATAAQGSKTVTFIASDMQGGAATATLTILIGNCVNSSSDVVISQVFGGGAHFDYVPNMDFAEIYNRSAAPVDLAGWNMQYQDTNGDFTPTKTVPLSGVIGAGERRIIAPQPQPGIGLVIPPPDFSAALPGFGFDNHFGRVALVKPIAPATVAATLVATGFGSGVQDSRGLVDLVGYGIGTPTFEGVSPTDTLSNGTYLVRKANGNQDFDQNIIDFEVRYILAQPHTTRTLTVNKITASTSTGAVSSDLPGINCGTACSGVFDRGAIITLTATPGARSKFVGWSGGACTGTDPCVVSLADSTTVTATFRCKADFNNDGVVTVSDIFAYLTAWFARDPSADVDSTSGVAVSDIFFYLSTWFGGC